MALAGTLSNCEYLQCIFLAPLLEETSATLCHLNKRDAGVLNRDACVPIQRFRRQKRPAAAQSIPRPYYQ